MNLIDKIRLVADGELEVCSKLSVDEITQICRDLRGVRSLLDWTTQNRDETKSQLEQLSARFTALIQQNSALAADNERLQSEQVELIDDLEQTKGELIRACAELSVIKKQEPVGYSLVFFGSTKPNLRTSFDDKASAQNYSDQCAMPDALVPNPRPAPVVVPLFAKQVHRHSFTISGIGTFYADSELEITYLERLHGVGGKANLKEVT